MTSALSAAKIPTWLELSGTYCSDGKRPWEHGKLLDWNATCSDTFAPSYITSASTEAGALAIHAAERKRKKYCDLATTHIFQPVAVETAGTVGPTTFKFLKSLAKRLREVSGEVNSYSYLIQRLAVTIQRANVASVHGSLDLLDPLFPSRRLTLLILF